MTGMLASVNSIEEAVLALTAEADIIDLKQPAAGALGALDIELVEQICRYCGGRRPVSATVGDLPMVPDLVFKSVRETAETGVDFVKIGLFPGGDREGTLRKLSALTQRNVALIAVLFADANPDLAIIEELKNAGFRGAMLDTMDKKKGSLTEVMSPARIGQFARLTQSRNMLCGLAGSLTLKDIPVLMACRPDYLGFRGALCVRRDRTAKVDLQSMIRIKAAIDAENAGHRGLYRLPAEKNPIESLVK